MTFKSTTATLALFALIAGFAMFAPASFAGDCPHSQPKAMAAAKSDIVDTAIGAGQFSTLVKAVQAAGLVDTLRSDGPFTVFAPTDEAFAKLPPATLQSLLDDPQALTAVLTYHVVSGRVPASTASTLDWAPTAQGQSARIQKRDGGLYIDGARIQTADIETSNGIIHVIDTVILPRKDIVDTAVAAGDFNTLVTAVKAAGLVETLKGKGPYTVFAPADSAFARLPDGTVAGLLKDKPALQSVLTYHVVPGRVLAGDIRTGSTQVKTANGQSLNIERDRSGNVTVNGARVVATDILAGNGIIHVIDAVVLPPQQ